MKKIINEINKTKYDYGIDNTNGCNPLNLPSNDLGRAGRTAPLNIDIKKSLFQRSCEQITRCRTATLAQLKTILDSNWKTWFTIAGLNSAVWTAISFYSIISKEDPQAEAVPNNPYALAIYKAPLPLYQTFIVGAMMVAVVTPMITTILTFLGTAYFAGTIFYLGVARKLLCDNEAISNKQKLFIASLVLAYALDQVNLIKNTLKLEESLLLSFFNQLPYDGTEFLIYYVIGSLMLNNAQVQRELDAIMMEMPIIRDTIEIIKEMPLQLQNLIFNFVRVCCWIINDLFIGLVPAEAAPGDFNAIIDDNE